MFSQLIVALANIGYVIIKKSNIELSIDGRLVVFIILLNNSDLR